MTTRLMLDRNIDYPSIKFKDAVYSNCFDVSHRSYYSSIEHIQTISIRFVDPAWNGANMYIYVNYMHCH